MPKADELKQTASFPKRNRLRKRYEFVEIQQNGRRKHTAHFILITFPRSTMNSDAQQRLGVTVTKKIGNAVDRNRIKRLVREVFRQNRQLFSATADTVVIAKHGAAALSYTDVLDQIRLAAAKTPLQPRRGA